MVTAYTRNKKLVQTFVNSYYERDFPIYHEQLTAKFDEGSERQKISEKAAMILGDALRFAGPNFEPFYMILSYLTREEIYIIINEALMNPEHPS